MRLPLTRVSALLALLGMAALAPAQVSLEYIGDAPTAGAPPTETTTTGAKITVATVWPPVHAIAHALAKGTPLEVARIPMTGSVPEREALRAHCEEVLPGLSAILTLGSAWPADPSYPAARAARIQTIEIDATRPLDGGGGIAMIPGASGESSGGPSLFWLSLENLSRMSEILARDFARLMPDAEATISANLARLKQDLRALSLFASQTLEDAAFGELADPDGQFAYLLQSLGLRAEPNPSASAPRLGRAASSDAEAVPLHTLLEGIDEDAPWPSLLELYRENIEKLAATLASEPVSP
ncbi:MAG: hypothetical protein RLZZ303_1134 [Candidatus Hydrogenedentota bacterium]|jgi:hypothetical protein